MIETPASKIRGETPPRRSRLREPDETPRFHPWQRAWRLKEIQVYWIPVESFPMPFRQRQWHLRFMELLSERMKQEHSVAPEHFLQMKTIMPLYRDAFIKSSSAFHPIFGLGRFPGRALPAVPDEKYAEDLQKGRISYDHKALQPDYTYWFLEKRSRDQSEMFLGSGGFTTLFLTAGEPPPAAPKIDTRGVRDPKLLALVENSDLDAMMATTHALGSPFLKLSKEMFAADLADDPQFPGILYALPLLGSQDFFAAKPETLEQWFSLFTVYLRESPEDKGCLLATSKDIELVLDEVLDVLKSEQGEYPA